MASVVNTNVASLTAQRNLYGTSNTLSTALGRLSSGLRINSAKDDAAGLAISTRFTAQIRGLNQAARNANDAISLTQTAEGALQTITDNLQRIRELAVQAVNASNSSTDRAALDTESDALIAEIDRVATTTQFNGVNLLDGTFASQAFQVGANASQTVSVNSITSARSAALGVGSGSSYSTTVTSGALTATALTAGQLNINNYAVGATSSDGVSYVSGDGSAIAKAAAINAISGNTNVTATVTATSVASTTTITGFTTALAASAVLINGVDIGAISTAATAAERGSQITAAINAKTSQTGVTATFVTSGANAGAVSLTAADGRNITVTTSAAALSVNTGLSVAASTTATSFGTLTLTSTHSAGITISDGGAGGGDTATGLTVGYTAATATAGAGVSSLDLTTASGAAAAITTIDAALATVNTSRASLGALQSRFSSTVGTLQSTSENLSAARSRILDADFAAETSALTRAQILQQAGTAMLAQANALPNNVLSLLKG